MIRPILIAPLLLLLFCHRSTAQREDTAPYDKTFPSPDGHFVAQLVVNSKQEDQISIKTTNHTGEGVLVYVLPPFFSLKWTGDSQTIVTIEHVVGGSITGLIHYNNGHWHRMTIEPAGYEDTAGHRRVLKQRIGFKTVELTYKLTDESHGLENTRFYVLTFEVDSATGATLKIVDKREISADAYDNLPEE